jgi:hypothetical protein
MGAETPEAQMWQIQAAAAMAKYWVSAAKCTAEEVAVRYYIGCGV